VRIPGSFVWALHAAGTAAALNEATIIYERIVRPSLQEEVRS